MYIDVTGFCVFRTHLHPRSFKARSLPDRVEGFGQNAIVMGGRRKGWRREEHTGSLAGMSMFLDTVRNKSSKIASAQLRES
jgi:hypothetical protein